MLNEDHEKFLEMTMHTDDPKTSMQKSAIKISQERFKLIALILQKLIQKVEQNDSRG